MDNQGEKRERKERGSASAEPFAQAIGWDVWMIMGN